MATELGRQYLQNLEPIRRQPGLLLRMEDDWTGVTSSAERRRVQNRLNQRAYRKRKQNETKHRHSSTSQSPPQPAAPQNQDSGPPGEKSSSSDTLESEIEIHSPISALWGLFHSAAERSQLDRQKLCHVAAICKLGPIEQQKIISEFKKWVDYCQKAGSPRIDHLLVLVKFNVFRALITNGIDLGYPAREALDDDALSHFADPAHARKFTLPIPAALLPTRLQQQIPHHPWIDVLPIPGMRDNLLRAGDTYDDVELCADLVGFFSASTGRTGMIIWGEPWDPNSWETTESFVRHWGWTIRGCEQLFRATNYWRERRGERPLRFEGVLYESGSD